MRCSRTLGLGVLLLAAAAPLEAATVTIAWDRNPEPEVTSYSVFVGLQPGSYFTGLSIGDRTSWTFTGLADNQLYYFAVQAQGASGGSPFAQIAYQTPPRPAPGSEVTRSDFNGDVFFDLLWQHRDGYISPWHMYGSTVRWTRWFSPNRVDPSWKLRGSGDLNGDGKPDLVWQNTITGDLSWWFMDGALLFDAGYFSISRIADTNWQIVAVRDMNRDGKPDLIWQHQTLGDLSVWYLNGVTVTATLWLNPTREANTNWKIRGCADFSGDGHPDLLWHNASTGELRVWFMNGVDRLWSQPLAPNRVADTNWKLVAVGDSNNDGSADLFWQNDANGGLILWLLRGITTIHWTYLSIPTISDLNWKIVGPR